MKRIMIPMRNEPGELAAVAQLLADGGIDIRSMDAEEIQPGEAGVIQLVVNTYDEALRLLRDAGYPAVTEDVLLVRVADEPGSLAKVAARFSEAGVNVRSLHILQRRGDESLVSLVTDDNDAARVLVADLLAG